MINQIEVHMIPPDKIQNRRGDCFRAFSIYENGMPRIRLSSISNGTIRKELIHNNIRWLKVENSRRYRPDSDKTYCNIYAYDVAFLAGCYIPRVWWKEEYIDTVIKGNRIDAIYGQTIIEMNCNRLFDWFERFGSLFLWKKFDDIAHAQERVNFGTLGVIIARSLESNKPGHISIILPDHKNKMAKYTFEEGLIPLQTQAGRINRSFFTDIWWKDSNFAETAFWVYEGISFT